MYIIVRTDDAGILWRLSPTNSVIECLLLEQSPNRLQLAVLGLIVDGPGSVFPTR